MTPKLQTSFMFTEHSQNFFSSADPSQVQYFSPLKSTFWRTCLQISRPTARRANLREREREREREQQQQQQQQQRRTRGSAKGFLPFLLFRSRVGWLYGKRTRFFEQGGSSTFEAPLGEKTTRQRQQVFPTFGLENDARERKSKRIRGDHGARTRPA